MSDAIREAIAGKAVLVVAGTARELATASAAARSAPSVVASTRNQTWFHGGGKIDLFLGHSPELLGRCPDLVLVLDGTHALPSEVREQIAHMAQCVQP